MLKSCDSVKEYFSEITIYDKCLCHPNKISNIVFEDDISKFFRIPRKVFGDRFVDFAYSIVSDMGVAYYLTLFILMPNDKFDCYSYEKNYCCPLCNRKL